MNRRGLILFVAVTLLGGYVGAQVQPKANVLLQATASTPSNFPYRIGVEVVAENRGQAASEAGKLELTLRPQVSRGSRPKSDVPTMWDPVVESQDLPALQPGERKVFTFETPFQARNSFKNARSSFKANNIDATQADVSVQMILKAQ